VRELPWRRRALYELSPSERDAVPVLPDAGELADSFGRFINYDIEFGLFLVLGLIALALLAVGALVGVARAWALPLLVDNARPIALAVAVAGALLLLDRSSLPAGPHAP
jgi:hypothetical protein